MSLHEFEFERKFNPLDMVEQVASGNDWAFNRDTETRFRLLSRVCGRNIM